MRKYFDRLQTVDYLIRIKGTGRPEALARRLGISEGSVIKFIAMMKTLGAPIHYDREKQSYIYLEKGGFSIRFDKGK